MTLTDATHDPALRSWVASANGPGADFPVQNLPFARLRRRGVDEPWRIGVAIGDMALDLRLAAGQCPWAEEIYPLLEPLAEGELAPLLQMGRPAWRALRAALSAALAEGSDQGPFLELCLVPLKQVEYALPCRIPDYTDFFAGIHHASAAGRLLRPDLPLLPNYKWVPVGYHGRASSIGLGGPVVRPKGQVRTSSGEPVYQPTRRLDYELEMGLFVGPGNPQGVPLTMEAAEDRLFGMVLLNDWSARDIQAWEYQPLGPFLAKSFATSISPWIVTMEALAPFRRPFTRPAGDPAPLPYLDSAFNREAGALDIHLEAWIRTPQMARPQRLSQSNLLDAYWTPAQLLTHHASNGCNLQPGDLLGTGTISGPAPEQGGSLLELTQGGRQPLALAGGPQRAFLEDGDEVTLRAYCEAEGAVRIGFGALSGTIAPAV
ncbi:MAG: fumarylacetoacetase [Rubrivivax sp.]